MFSKRQLKNSLGRVAAALKKYPQPPDGSSDDLYRDWALEAALYAEKMISRRS